MICLEIHAVIDRPLSHAENERSLVNRNKSALSQRSCLWAAVMATTQLQFYNFSFHGLLKVFFLQRVTKKQNILKCDMQHTCQICPNETK